MNAPTLPTSPDQPALAEAAGLVQAITEQSCRPDCRAYHTVWPFMRLYGVLPSVLRDHARLTATIAEAAAAGARRILVSGAADFGILAYVIDGYEKAGLSAEVTVADLCGSPLALNRWYAQRQGWRVRTVEADIRRIDGGPFDLIIAHNFFNFFTPAQRIEVAEAWKRVLAPTGRLVLFASLYPSSPERVRRFGEARLEALVEATLEAKHGSTAPDVIADDALIGLVRAFGEARVVNALGSLAAIEEPLRQAGLDLETIDRNDGPVAGVPSEGARTRLRLVARHASKVTAGAEAL